MTIAGWSHFLEYVSTGEVFTHDGLWCLADLRGRIFCRDGMSARLNLRGGYRRSVQIHPESRFPRRYESCNTETARICIISFDEARIEKRGRLPSRA